MSTSPTQSTESSVGFHELKKELRPPVEETPQDKSNKKLPTSVGEQDANGKTFLVAWENLSRPTNPRIVFSWAREVGSVRREGCVVGSDHQASVGEQDADAKLVCCDCVVCSVVGSVHQASVGEQDADGKPVCCVRLKLDEKDPSSDHEDSSSDHEDSSSDGKPVCCVRLKLDDDDDLYR